MRNWVWNFWEKYWQWIGGPLSRIEAKIVDSIPFAVVESVIWLCLVLISVSFIPRFFKKLHLLRFIVLIFGLVLISGQGVFGSFFLVPSAWRPPLAERLPKVIVDTQQVRALYDIGASKLLGDQTQLTYQNIDRTTVINDANQSLDKIIKELGYAPGREVSVIKEMQGLSRMLGSIYGGPAYHDPITTEIALVPDEFPMPKYWTIVAIFHEIAHAKGFSREIDAELLTWFALWRSPKTLYHNLAWMMFLSKTGAGPIKLPIAWEKDRSEKRLLRKKYFENHSIENFLKNSAESLGLINGSEKYGNAKGIKEIKSTHPFFGPVIEELHHGRF